MGSRRVGAISFVDRCVDGAGGRQAVRAHDHAKQQRWHLVHAAKVRALQAIVSVRGAVHLLTLLAGDLYCVTCNRVVGAVVQATPVHRSVASVSDWLYQLPLRLITVAPPDVGVMADCYSLAMMNLPFNCLGRNK